jgi:hypothetical protein
LARDSRSTIVACLLGFTIVVNWPAFGEVPLRFVLPTGVRGTATTPSHPSTQQRVFEGLIRARAWVAADLAGKPADHPHAGVIVFFLQIDTLGPKNVKRDKHLQNRLFEVPCAFGAN